jgi:hypothetical protein
MSAADWADRKYIDGELTAHLVPFGETTAICSLTPEDWFGTGDMDEVEVAAALPLCLDCHRITNPSTTIDPAVDAWSEAMKEAMR